MQLPLPKLGSVAAAVAVTVTYCLHQLMFTTFLKTMLVVVVVIISMTYRNLNNNHEWQHQHSGRGPSGQHLGDGSRTQHQDEADTVGTGQVGMCHRYELTYAKSHPDAPDTLVAKFASDDAGSRVGTSPLPIC